MKKYLLLLFLFSTFSIFAQHETVIQEYLNRNYTALNVNQADISDWFVESNVFSKSTKITNYYIKQRYQGIEIYHAQTNFSIKNNTVFNVANRFESDLQNRVNTTSPSLNVFQALELAYGHFTIQKTEPFIVLENIRPNYFKISNGIGLVDEPVLAKLVYQLADNNFLRLAWDFTFYSENYKNLWSVRIDAVNGSVLEKNDLVVNCNFENESCSLSHNHFKPFTKKIALPEITSATDGIGTYRVYPYNIESPKYASAPASITRGYWDTSLRILISASSARASKAEFASVSRSVTRSGSSSPAWRKIEAQRAWAYCT